MSIYYMFGGIFSDSKKKKRKKRSPKGTRKISNCYGGAEKRNGTCYSREDLLTMRNLWNAKHPDKQIKSKDPNGVWKKFDTYLQHVCTSESCWLKQQFIDKNIASNIFEESFTPAKPQKWKINPVEWLDSLDIEKVMHQYENENDNFEFLGPSPIDFDAIAKGGNDCVFDEICNLNIEEKYNKGIKNLGFIFNLDPHYKSGSHWVSLFVNLDTNYIFFLDTNGNYIPEQVKQLVKRIKTQCKSDLHKKMRFIDNAPRRHQHEGTECGIYCLYAIVSQLKGIHTPQWIKRNRIPDNEMKEFRDIFYTDRSPNKLNPIL
jgi:hypothetical protein